MEVNRMSRASNAQNIQVRGIKVKRKPMFDDNSKVLLNGVQLTFEKGFGFNQNPDMRSNSFSIDDNRLIYILSKQIVVYDMLAESQKIIDQLSHEQQFTCFLYFKNIMLDDNVLYGVQNQWKSSPTIVLHNFSKEIVNKYVLSHLQKEQKVNEVCLLNQNNNFCVISQLEGCYRLSILEIQTKKLYASENIYFKPIGMIVPHQHPKYIFIYSDKEIYIIVFDKEIKITALNIKKYLTNPSECIVQIVSSLHAHLTLYAITNAGNLHLITINLLGNSISQVQTYFLGTFETIDPKTSQPTIQNRRPSSLCCNEYNILIGYELVEQFTLASVSSIGNQKVNFQHIKFCCPFLHRIVRMNFAYETMAVCVVVQVKENDKYGLTIPIQSEFLKEKGEHEFVATKITNHLLPPGKIFPIVFNLLLHDTLVETLRSPVQSVLTSMLMVKEILDISILSTKKLILILTAEKKIKAIKYQHVSSTSFERMLAWETTFNSNDQPYAIDAHPLTFHVAVGFKEGIKIFIICVDGLKTTNIQFNLKNCQTVKYSKYGHKLVVGSSNQIVLINPYKHQIEHTIQMGYGYNTRQLSFIDRDAYLFGVFSNGTSMVINLEGVKVIEVGTKNTKVEDLKVLCSAYDRQFDILAIGYESRTLFYKDHGNQDYASIYTQPYNHTRILIINQIGSIFFGTSLGTIRCHQWPFTDRTKFKQNYTQIQLHKSPISQLTNTHDYSMIVSGALDGSVFISKINAYSDGIIVNDSQMLHTFRTVNKNYTSLYYLQNYMCTNSSMQSQLQEKIVQLQSDKADFSSEYNDAIMVIQQGIDKKVKQQQQNRAQQLKQELIPHQKNIEDLNGKKSKLREQLQLLRQNYEGTSKSLNEQKLNKMRQLYEQSDRLKQKKQFYIELYRDELIKVKKELQNQISGLRSIERVKMKDLQKKCQEVQNQKADAIINYREVMKEEDLEGQLYKKTMLAQMQQELEKEQDRGQNQRKKINKSNHQISKEKEKMKYFEQLIKDLEIQRQNAIKKKVQLTSHLAYLTDLLDQKDKQIFREEKTVKELLTNNINNYSHQEYLKYRQEELLSKATYLQSQIEQLENKYQLFQHNFIQAYKQTSNYDTQISQAMQTIRQLKSQSKKYANTFYQLKYSQESIYSVILGLSNKEYSDRDQMVREIKSILSDDELAYQHQEIYSSGNMQINVEKRDHKIKQVMNTNNLRKIGDNIRRTIMVKLNRQTVSLTCQVNQLRKEKRNLTNKIKQIQTNMRLLKDMDTERDKSALQEIVPVNISIIRSNSKSSNKLLPFQQYHQNNAHKLLAHSQKNKTQSDYDESTQLPSIFVKNSNINSLIENSNLEGVEENADQIIQ